jgi:type IV pilus assembly protein PilB
MDLLKELFSNGTIQEAKLKELQDLVLKSSKPQEEVILENKVISEEALFELKSKLLRIPLQKVDATKVLPEVLELIPSEAATNYQMAAFAKTENFVSVGMVYPENMLGQNALRFLANQQKFNYHIYLITPSDFTQLQKARNVLSSEARRALEDLDDQKDAILKDLNKSDSVTVISADAPVVRMVEIILQHALETNASDIHIEPWREGLNIRFRKNGLLRSDLTLPSKVQPSIAARIKILAGLKIDENRLPQDGRFSEKINGKDVDFRVATFPTLYGEKVELRVLDSSVGMRTFAQLGLEGRNLDIVQAAIAKPNGMTLLCGPTGSGKTTTQYAILHVLNKETVNIVTVEDPIEYAIDGVNQSQVKPEIGYTFASGLREILRQDPNVIMVGEIRDEETANLAVNASLTGHVVLSTLHTNSSVGAVPRLIDMGVKPFLIPATLRAVISQRLVRTLCDNCKVRKRPTAKIEADLQAQIALLSDSAKEGLKLTGPLNVYEPKGCQECNFTGYRDRVGLFEVLEMSDELAELVLKNPLESFILKEAKKQGMLTMQEAGLIKIIQGQTTVEEVARVTEER